MIRNQGDSAAHRAAGARHHPAPQHGAAASTGVDVNTQGDGDAVPAQFVTAHGASYSFVASDPPPPAGQIDIAALTAGSKWTSVDPASGRTVLTYSFADPQLSTYAYAGYPAGLQAFSDADKTVTREILANIEAVCNVHFVEVPDDADMCGVIRYAYSPGVTAAQLAGYGFFPSTDPQGGDVWLGTQMETSAWDRFRPDLILHETLHALGLKHPFGSGIVLPTDQNVIPETVMSYSPVAGSTTGSLSAYPTQPMPLDVSTLQFLYGAPQVAAQDATYDLSTPQFQSDFSTIYHAGGHVTLDASAVGHGVTLDLHENARSDIGVAVTASGVVNGTMVTTVYHSTLAIAPGTVVQEAIGTNFGDTITANDAGDLIIGGSGDDHLIGGAGNDVFVPNRGNDTIDGGGGLNEADYSGARADYAISVSGPTLTVAESQPARDGSDTLVNVQRLKFADGWIAFDTSGDAGEAYRLYQAAFDRAPDQVGLGFWIHALDGGVALHDVAQAFLGTPEFAQRFGSLDAQQYVTQLYANVLHRAPDPGGLAFHLGNLESGAIDRAGLLAFFSESPENQAALIGTIAHGIPYIG